MHGTIVCGVSDPPEARAVIQLAAALGERLGMRLVLVHVIAPTRQVERYEPGTSGHCGIECTLDAIAREFGEATETRVVWGNRVDGLAQAAAEEGADVIVLGSRPGGARGRQLHCALARELEAATVVPVLIAPPATRDRGGLRLALGELAAGR
ncbi:MAG: universal stress protein [Gaiellaceae bacterium]